MNELKKALWLSVFLTGAGQFYLGDKKKGWNFLLFSILGVVFVCAGAALIAEVFWGFLLSVWPKIFSFLGFLFSITGLVLIVVSGYESIKDIVFRKNKAVNKS
jgi:hypothetical protein